MKLRNKKTGEIIEYDEEVIYYRKLTSNGHEDWTPYHPEDWEDCEPTEPLIKDEKIRKAVRSWWECIPNGVEDKRILYKANHDLVIGTYIIYCGAIYPIGTLTEGKYYTIAELCGEEEG